MRTYVVYFHNRSGETCKRVVRAVNRRQAIRRFMRKSGRFVKSIFTIQEA